MSLIWPNVGEIDALNALKPLCTHMYLYSNDYHPVPGSVVGDFVESTFPGYTSAALSWGPTATNANGKAESIAALCTFTFTGGAPATVYGYYVRGPSPYPLRFAERAPAPILLTTAGDTIKIQVTMTLESLF